MSSQPQLSPAPPLLESAESNEKLSYDEPNTASAQTLRTSPSEQFAAMKPPSPKSNPIRPVRLNGVSSTTNSRKPPTPALYTQNGTYWGPLPERMPSNKESFDYPRVAERTSFSGYEPYEQQQQQQQQQHAYQENEEIQPVLDPTPPRRVQRQASIDPFPTHIQTIPTNPNRPRSRSHSQRPGADWRNVRSSDAKTRSYRFEYMPDIRSEGHHRGLNSPGGSFYGQHGPGQFGPGHYTPGLYPVQYGKAGNAPVAEVMRLPLTWWMNSNAKNHFVAMIAEFVGTTMFLFFAFAGTQVANADSRDTTTITNVDVGFNPIVLLYTAVAFGFSLMVNAWIFFRISGGLFNPAVTLAMVMVKSLDYVRGVLLFIAQICGSLLASVLVRALFPTPLNVRTTLGEGTSIARGIFIEAILTAELVFTIFMLAKEKHRATYMAPVGIGLALFIAELVGVFYTGGSLNPARSFGPCAITGVWDAEHWIYWAGPGIGALIAVVFYKFIKILEYEIANPGQDDDREESPLDAATANGSLWHQSRESVAMKKKDLENQTIAEE